MTTQPDRHRQGELTMLDPTTIPTADLVGCVADALKFVSPDKDDIERRCVHLRWDGELLHASAINGIAAAVSSWSIDDKPDSDVQDTLGTILGGGDPWEFLLAHDDAVHLLATAKPVKNLEYVPLFLTPDGDALLVKRAKQSRLPGFSLAYDGMTHTFPDVREHLVRAMAQAEPTKEVWLGGSHVELFAKVRQRGAAMKWTLSGPNHPAVVEIGARFVGAIQPVRAGDEIEG